MMAVIGSIHPVSGVLSLDGSITRIVETDYEGLQWIPLRTIRCQLYESGLCKELLESHPKFERPSQLNSQPLFSTPRTFWPVCIAPCVTTVWGMGVLAGLMQPSLRDIWRGECVLHVYLILGSSCVRFGAVCVACPGISSSWMIQTSNQNGV